MTHAHLFRPTVARFDGRAWWLMNHPEKGWASFGYRYETLDDLCAGWSVDLGPQTIDALGPVVEVLPK